VKSLFKTSDAQSLGIVKKKLVTKLTNTLGNLNISNISSKESLKGIIQEYTKISDSIWYKFSKNVNITKYSKAWWNEECSIKLNMYQFTKSIVDWKKFKDFIKKTKYNFFNEKIQEIVSENKRS